VNSLVASGVTWTNRHDETMPTSLNDILIVAPYNAQVSEIVERLPETPVGTVDKFQGQEAPIVIYSMATSGPEDAPHGMEFLFSRHRLNMATSRAMRLHPRRQPRAVRAGVPNAGANADGERVLPLPRASALDRGRMTHK
jgi:AAA domain